MSTELQGQSPATSENEDWYDREIAPALAALARRCGDRGIGMLAVVEFQPGQRGGTYLTTPNDTVGQQMIRICMQAAPNLDAFLLAFSRHCRKHGVDTSESVVLRAIGRMEN